MRPLLETTNLDVDYRLPGRPKTAALRGITLSVCEGETLGIVGESGSGKTTLGRAVLGQVPVSGGAVTFDGQDITRASTKERRRLSRELQVVFQDPYSSLNPARTIGQSIAEPLIAHGTSRAAARKKVEEVLLRVGLPSEASDRYPSEFSGGQRQRIAIARAVIGSPRLIVCDEPVSALDLSVQAQVLNLLQQLQREANLAMIFIAHDLAVVRYISQRIVVLYRGRIVEEGPAEEVCSNPRHPYTQALVEASPVPDRPRQLQRRRERGKSERPSGRTLSGTGCPFASKCAYLQDECTVSMPPLANEVDRHSVACIRADKVALARASAHSASHPVEPYRSRAH